MYKFRTRLDRGPGAYPTHSKLSLLFHPAAQHTQTHGRFFLSIFFLSSWLRSKYEPLNAQIDSRERRTFFKPLYTLFLPPAPRGRRPIMPRLLLDGWGLVRMRGVMMVKILSPERTLLGRFFSLFSSLDGWIDVDGWMDGWIEGANKKTCVCAHRPS